MSNSSTSSTPQSSVILPPTFSNSVSPSSFSLFAHSPTPANTSLFHNTPPFKFWSSDYRSGITSIYTALQAGCVQSQEVLGFIRERVESERQISIGLIPNALREDGFGAGKSLILEWRIGAEQRDRELTHEPFRFIFAGFCVDEGASLRMGYEAILTSAVGESKARTRLADELMVRTLSS